MKKIIVFLAICTMALCVSSCSQAPGLTMTPASITIKVGQTEQMHPTILGEGIEFSDVVAINSPDGVCFFNKNFQVTGLKAGVTTIGIGVPNDPKDESKGMKYSAYSRVTVVE